MQIKDLSRNGTFLNGELIGQNQQRLITTGDVIAIIEPDMKGELYKYFKLLFLTTFSL